VAPCSLSPRALCAQEVKMFFLFLATTMATLLPVTRKSACAAHLNATVIDFENQFVFPVTIDTVAGNSPSGVYSYSWDCHGSKTPCGAGMCSASTAVTNTRTRQACRFASAPAREPTKSVSPLVALLNPQCGSQTRSIDPICCL
jgi:hypothetical protein